MIANLLEELVAEWQEYQGGYVRRNIPLQKRSQGGRVGEIDILAYSPESGSLLHIETSMDSWKWEKRERIFGRKFREGEAFIRKEIMPQLPHGMKTNLIKLVVLGRASRKGRGNLGGADVRTLDELLREIMVSIRDRNAKHDAIPQHLPLLRMVQIVSDRKEMLMELWLDSWPRLRFPRLQKLFARICSHIKGVV